MHEHNCSFLVAQKHTAADVKHAKKGEEQPLNLHEPKTIDLLGRKLRMSNEELHNIKPAGRDSLAADNKRPVNIWVD